MRCSTQRRITGPSFSRKNSENRVNETAKASEVSPCMPLVMPLTSVEMMFGRSVLTLLVASEAPFELTPASCNQPWSFVAAAELSDEI